MQSTTSELNSQIVRAGAGAGKTTRLTEQIFLVAKQFINESGRWPKLVVTTFTRKATQELRERLVVKACKESDTEILKYLSSSNIQISTIHGVLSLFMRRYGHLLGWDNSFEVMGGNDSFHLAKEVLLETAMSQEWKGLHKKFEFSHLCHLMLAYYEKDLAEGGSQFCTKADFELLHLSYLKRIGEEIQELAELMASVSVPKWLEYSEKLIQIANLIEQGELSKPMSGGDVLERIKSLGSRPRKTKEVPDEVSEGVQNLFDGIKKDLAESYLEPQLWPEFLAVYEEFGQLASLFVNKFVEKKQIKATLEMRDLELLAANIIRTEPELVKAFSEEWDYWLIDEFQDTSPLQDKILNQFIGDKAVFIVGDPQQSIYLFRGARSEVFAQKEVDLKDYHNELMINYRSNPDLLSFINNFFSKFDQKFKAMDFNPKGEWPASPRKVAEFYCEPNEKSPDFETGNNCLEYIKRKVTDLIGNGEKAEQICILSRKNASLLETAHYLSLANLPTHVHASSGYFERREILDSMGILQFFLNPHDNENLIMLLRSPWLGVSDHSLYRYSQLAKAQRCSLWLAQTENAAEDFAEAKRELSKHYLRYQSEGVCVAFELAIQELGLIDFSHYHDSTGRRESNLWKAVNLLREAEKSPGFNLSQFLWRRGLDLSASESSGETDAVASLEPNAINLMTIHAAKGLQFNHVFVLDAAKKPDLSGGARGMDQVHMEPMLGHLSFRCPIGVDAKLTKSIADQNYIVEMQKREKQEHDRLIYVALTRAKINLYICSKGEPQKDSWLERSKFDLGLGEHLCEGFTYSVNNKLPPESNFVMGSKNKVQSGKVFEFKHKSQRLNKYSVSRLLDELSDSDFARDQVRGKDFSEPNKSGNDLSRNEVGRMDPSRESLVKKNKSGKEVTWDGDSRYQATSAVGLRETTIGDGSTMFEANNNVLSKGVEGNSDFSRTEASSNVSARTKVSGGKPKSSLPVLKKLMAVTDGVNLHGLFEALHYDSSIDIENYLNHNFGGDISKAASAVQWTLSLDRPPIKKLIESGEVEWGFQIKTAKGLVEGQIDLWGVVDGTCWVIDYKSGSQKYKQRALQQLELYASALFELGHKNIKLAIVYPNTKTTEIVPFDKNSSEILENLKSPKS